MQPSQRTGLHKLVRLLGAALFCAALLVSAAPSHAEVIDRIVAKINKEIITLNDLKRASGPYLLAFGIEPSSMATRSDAGQIYKQVLDDMINTRLLVQEARTLQLKISEDDVSNWIRNTITQQKLSEDQFRGALRSKGIRWQDYRQYIQDNLLKFRVIQTRIGSRVKVTDEELNDAYRDEFGEDPDSGIKTIEVSHIFLPVPENPSEDQLQRLEELVKRSHKRVAVDEEDFAAVAKEVSSGPTASDGGYLGTYQPGDLAQEIDQIIFSKQEGDITDPIRVSSGYHIFRVHGLSSKRDPRVEERMKQLTGKLREAQLNKQLTQWIETLREKSYVRVQL